MEILRILYTKNETLGAKLISEELKKRGYYLGERAVRYHMHMLDEKGFTEKVGYRGRKITEKGLDELKKGLVYNQVDFTYTRFEEKMYKVTLNHITSNGSVIVNLSTINDEMSKRVIDDFFKEGLTVSQRYNYYEQNDAMVIETVCGNTIDGIFQKNGIITKPLYGGLLKVEDYSPVMFTEQIAYEKTSVTPLEAFSGNDNTSVLDVANEGTGVIPANFRIIPASKKEDALKILDSLNKIGIGGVIDVGNSGESVLGIPVPKDMIGITIIGGVAPLCAAQEAGYDLNIKVADSFAEYSQMKSLRKYVDLPLKDCTKNNKQITFVLNRIFNLMSKVDFDVESAVGDVITNVSYVDKESVDESLEIINNLYKNKPEYCIGNRYGIIDDEDKVGIATICSLTLDGILVNNGIPALPTYGGVLDISEDKERFIELMSYTGSSLDPHEIFIKNNLHDIHGSLKNSGKILASVHSIPYVARDSTLDILDKLNESGFEELCIGKTNEYMYNAKIDKYHFGYVLAGGLNPIAAIKEKNINTKVKSIEKIMDYNTLEEL